MTFHLPRLGAAIKGAVLTVAISVWLFGGRTAARQAKLYPLDSADGLRLHNVSAERAVLHGKKGVRVTVPEEVARRLQKMTPDEEVRFPQLAVIDGLEFSNGVIEAEIAGTPAPGAGESARGFVGIAFRLKSDGITYDAFYLRPTNGRAEDQERRNHAVQYISHPDWPWFRLRKETPSKYESYVDLVPGVWTRMKIDVRGERARLYVHNQQQPTLIVNDLKTGADGKGAIALMGAPTTVAHFRKLRVDHQSAQAKRLRVNQDARGCCKIDWPRFRVSSPSPSPSRPRQPFHSAAAPARRTSRSKVP